MERKAGSIGTPIQGVEMKVVDDDGKDVPQGEIGEIVIRGHNIMKGYWDRPEATAEAITADGWFHSGDMAKVDEDGYFFIVDRKKDLIIRGGYNVYPREVEEVLYEHPAVAEAAVIGVPDDDLGERVVAFVVAAGTPPGERELADHVAGLLAPHKRPREVRFTDALPRNDMGKVVKKRLPLD
jgi:long-chain acyl-CoA synthetase